MGKYLRLFETHAGYEEARQNLILPNVSYCEDNKDVHFNPLPYQGFCKLTLNNGSTVELEGSGELSGSMVDSYRETLVSAEIGELCTSIAEFAFSYCTSLASVTIPNSVKSISTEAFSNCTSLASVTIPNSVTSIGDGVFSDCTSLTSVTIPDRVTSIDVGTFGGCTSLTSVTIPDRVTSIGSSAFNSCSGLTSVTIGSGVTSIAEFAFESCTSLTSVRSLAMTAPTIHESTFLNVKTSGTLTVPIGSSGYNVWMGTGNYYLGKYNWTKVEQ